MGLNTTLLKHLNLTNVVHACKTVPAHALCPVALHTQGLSVDTKATCMKYRRVSGAWKPNVVRDDWNKQTGHR